MTLGPPQGPQPLGLQLGHPRTTPNADEKRCLRIQVTRCPNQINHGTEASINIKQTSEVPVLSLSPRTGTERGYLFESRPIIPNQTEN